ncbi:MAG TPA: LysR substrate-binding domain-containing protein [Hypericibacter adhaerens]|uniref:LysR substrate-binding domain-containing protein n=1 Tax=Hypericibacter adhaerens TaxID=2602016 RepID=UPI002BF99AE7|nr:LysR substrate-binding domain-containing protein [Hypericibacter adhaerens]HWA42949.1 LysR substrate-binding domain-containing protein [Hypericibacter adhaerens]
MDRFPLPLNALRAIEIVARTGALRPAAEELGVTIGAVSQHIRRAEARLKLDLFVRTPHGLQPTPELEQVRGQLSAGFTMLLDATAALRRADDRVLSVTMGSVFASRWLIRRLPHFTAAHPEIEFRLVATARTIDLMRTDIDCAIRFGEGRWPDVRAEPMRCRAFRPVAAPELAARLRRPSDLGRVPVIEDTATMLSWTRWFEAADAVAPKLAGPRYSDPSLAFDAAIAGQGALLAVDRMSEDAVAEGRLVRPFDTMAETAFDYWFVTSTARRIPRKVRLFHDWLFAEMGL